MTGMSMVPSARRPSRAPAYVTIAGLAVALGLVVYALRDTPAPVVVIDAPGTSAQPRAVNVILRDYLFEPTPLVLVRGETVRIAVINGGLETHELVLGDARVQQAWESAHAAATPPAPLATAPPASVPADVGGARISLGSGQQGTLDYTVPVSGVVQVICHVPGHVEQGMVGQVELREGEAE